MSEDATLDDFVKKEPESVDGFKETAAGRIPSDWDTENVEMLCELRNGKATNHTDIGESEYLVYGSNGPIGSHSESNFDEGLIFGRVGAVGEVERVRQPVWVSDNAIQATVNKGCNTDFLYYFLSNKELSSLATKTAQPLLNQSTIGNVTVPTPPISEQRKIATVLYNVDRAIQKTEEIIDQISRVKEGLVQDLFINGIDHDEYKQVNVGPATYEIPKNWEVKKINEIAEVTSSKRVHEEDYVEQGVPFYRSKEIIRKSKGLDVEDPYLISEDKFESLIKKTGFPNEGDILITAVGTLGVPYLVRDEKFYFKDGNLQWIKNPDIRSQFLRYFMDTEVFESQILRRTAGSSQGALTIGNLSDMTIFYPDGKEQEQISTKIKRIDDLRDNNLAYKNHLERLKKGLMQDLLSGTVRTADTNIEVPEEIAQHG